MKVAIVMSFSNLELIQKTVDILDKFGIDRHGFIISDHRTTKKVRVFLDNVERQGINIFQCLIL